MIKMCSAYHEGMVLGAILPSQNHDKWHYLGQKMVTKATKTIGFSLMSGSHIWEGKNQLSQVVF